MAKQPESVADFKARLSAIMRANGTIPANQAPAKGQWTATRTAADHAAFAKNGASCIHEQATGKYCAACWDGPKKKA